MKLIYKDDLIAVCEKCAGELSEGEGNACIPTLLSQALRENGERNTKIFPVHRLDKETAGLIVYARTAEAAASLSESIREGSFQKQYLTVVGGVPQKNEDTLCDLLFYDRQKSKSFIVKRERGGVKKASLDYSLLSTKNGLSMLHIQLHTGRTHQIRVQLSSRGLPVVGDRRYGSPIKTESGIALLSYKLSFPHPENKNTSEFTADIPNLEPWNIFEQT